MSDEKKEERTRTVDKDVLVMAVLAVLLVIVAFQAIQLGGIKAQLTGLSASGVVSAAAVQGSAPPTSAPVSAPLPSMVGGC